MSTRRVTGGKESLPFRRRVWASVLAARLFHSHSHSINQPTCTHLQAISVHASQNTIVTVISHLVPVSEIVTCQNGCAIMFDMFVTSMRIGRTLCAPIYADAASECVGYPRNARADHSAPGAPTPGSTNSPSTANTLCRVCASGEADADVPTKSHKTLLRARNLRKVALPNFRMSRQRPPCFECRRRQLQNITLVLQVPDSSA